MKKGISYYLVILLIIITLITGFKSFGATIDGRDNGVYLSRVFTIINFSAILVAILTLLRLNKTGKLKDVRLHIVALVIISLVSIYSFNLNYVRIYDRMLTDIDSTEAIERRTAMERSTIYFYREDCPYCEIVDKPLRKYLFENNMYFVKSYRTISSDELKEQVLEQYGVDQVPLIIEVRNGDIVRRIYYDEIMGTIDAGTLQLSRP